MRTLTIDHVKHWAHFEAPEIFNPANIAFLLGNPPDDLAGGGKPNANVPVTTATFWVEEGTKADGSPLLQLQYTQRVLLNFNGLSWPHVTVATLSAM